MDSASEKNQNQCEKKVNCLKIKTAKMGKKAGKRDSPFHPPARARTLTRTFAYAYANEGRTALMCVPHLRRGGSFL